jgi:hypothetical protein
VLRHFLGKATWPNDPPRVEVTAVDPAGGSSVPAYRLEAEAAGRLLRHVSMVAIAFWEERADGSRRALALETIHPGEPKTLAIPHQGELIWRAAGYNHLRQRGRPILPKPPQAPHTAG